MIYVTVNQPAGRDLYINGVYDDVVGSIPLTVPLDSGPCLFETLNDKHAIDFRSRVGNVADGTVIPISLRPVNPPEPA
jgi:hypothetical protein